MLLLIRNYNLNCVFSGDREAPYERAGVGGGGEVFTRGASS